MHSTTLKGARRPRPGSPPTRRRRDALRLWLCAAVAAAASVTTPDIAAACDAVEACSSVMSQSCLARDGAGALPASEEAVCEAQLVEYRTCLADAVTTCDAAATPVTSRLSLTPERIIEIQELLVRRGFDPGTINGVWSPQMSDAIRQARRAAGLSDEAIVDEQLETALRAVERETLAPMARQRRANLVARRLASGMCRMVAVLDEQKMDGQIGKSDPAFVEAIVQDTVRTPENFRKNGLAGAIFALTSAYGCYVEKRPSIVQYLPEIERRSTEVENGWFIRCAVYAAYAADWKVGEISEREADNVLTCDTPLLWDAIDKALGKR